MCVVMSVLLTIASRLSVHCGSIVADFVSIASRLSLIFFHCGSIVGDFNGAKRVSFQVLGFDRHKARILVEFFDGSDLYSLGPPHIKCVSQ